jgi:hypothetical protein
MFTSCFTIREQEHRQWTPYKHGAPSASPNTAFVTPCTAPLHASKNLRAPLPIRVRGARGKSCAVKQAQHALPQERERARKGSEQRWMFTG